MKSLIKNEIMQINQTILAKCLLVSSLILGAVPLTGCEQYNQLPTQEEKVNAAWSEVVNQYKRRADLIPGLVNTVKGYAKHEESTLTAVTKARSAATSFQITPETLNNPEALKKFEAIQGDLAQAMSRLMMLTENYPALKADAGFRDLQAQLEGTENRITRSRDQYIKTVQEYNTMVRTFPTIILAKIAGFQPKPNFSVNNEQAISNAPEVKF